MDFIKENWVLILCFIFFAGLFFDNTKQGRKFWDKFPTSVKNIIERIISLAFFLIIIIWIFWVCNNPTPVCDHQYCEEYPRQERY